MHGISGQTSLPLANPESGIDRLIYQLVAYVLPVVFLLVSLLALVNWTALDTAPADDPVVFRTLPDLRRRPPGVSTSAVTWAITGSSRRTQAPASNQPCSSSSGRFRSLAYVGSEFSL